MNVRVLYVFVICVVSVCAVENKSEYVRDKRTLHIVLKAFADSLGYDIQKRPPLPRPLPKPAGGRSPVNPPLVPPMMPPPKAPAPPMMPAPKAPPMMPAPMMPVPMMPAPKAPAAPMPAPKAPAPAPAAPAPKAPPAPMMPAPKAPAQPAPKANAPRLPTVPPLLTETIQKMFNINFNWNKNVQTPAPATMAPKAPAPPINQAPAPAPKAPVPAPKAPALAPAPSQAPVPAPKAPAAPATTSGPVKHVLYSYDYDDGQLTYPQNLKDYDNYYQYDNTDNQQPQQQQEPENQQQQSQEEVKQSQEEVASPENDASKIEDVREKQNEAYGQVQNFWQNSPWQNNQQENYEEESRIPQFGGHNFVVNHPGGSSYSRMEHKKVETIKQQPKQQQSFEAPIYYYEEQHQPPLESRNLQVDHQQQNYHFQGPSFDQYFYAHNSDEQKGEKTNVEINSSGEKGIKQPAESRQKETISPEATLPVPAHNIYQANPYLQWISPFEASSEQREKKVKALPQQIEQNQNKGQRKEGRRPDFYTFNYEPDHYSSDFTAHTIPPPSQEDYSKYEPEQYNLENEFSDKAQVKEEQFGRKYTTVHTDNLVHHRIGQ